MLYNGKDHLKASKTIQSKKIRYISKLANFLLLCNLFFPICEPFCVSYLPIPLPCYSATAFRILELPAAELNGNFTFPLETVCVIPTV